MSKFKKITHGIAVGVVAVGSFLAAHHQEVLNVLAAFPKSSIAGIAATVVGALYFNSQKSEQK